MNVLCNILVTLFALLFIRQGFAADLGTQPQFSRPQVKSLDGSWEFAFDENSDSAVGESQKWYEPGNADFTAHAQNINVPYPYETQNSGIGKPDEIHTNVWYRKTFVTPPQFDASQSYLLHFSAVDYDTKVWINGKFLGRHIGGHTAFEFDTAPYLNKSGEPNTIVFKAYDDVRDPLQRKGKQRPNQEAIFYKHTTGAFRSITLAQTSKSHLKDVQVTWLGDVKELEFIPHISSHEVGQKLKIKIYEMTADGQKGSLVKTVESGLTGKESAVRVGIENPKLWFPRDQLHPQWKPNLYHLEYELLDSKNNTLDQISSYTGLKTLRQTDGKLYINDEHLVLRGVLNQLYREDTQLAAPESVIKDEFRKIRKSGYNFARLHQSFDPRALAWADFMGILVSAEAPSPEEITPSTEKQALAEVAEMVVEARNHPALIQIDDINESWGLRFIDKRDGPYRDLYAKDPKAAEAMRQFNIDYIKKSGDVIRGLIKSGHSLDGKKLGYGLKPDKNGNSYGVLIPSNDGWDNTDEGNSTQLHRYDHDGDQMQRVLGQISPRPEAGELLPPTDAQERPEQDLKRAFTQGFGYNKTPIYLSEFGGVSYVDESETVRPGTWGYAGLERKKKDFMLRLHGLFAAVSRLNIAGFTYTQLKRTGFEVNGTLTEYGVPILPLKLMNAIVTMGYYPNPQARIKKVEKMINTYFDQQLKCADNLSDLGKGT